MWRLTVFGLLCVLHCACAQGELPTVSIAQGTVIGSSVTDGQLEYYQYLGVPYAGSTAGTQRFKAPTAPPTFPEDFIADRDDVSCIRSTPNGFEGTEDCLVANIYTPATSTNSSVVVWIQGSELQDGTEYALSFRNFLEQDVIVVTLNYRESIFGFLCLGVEGAPGNAGLKDIIAGLKWVQENIASFGGDSESITLFGHGSGASAVDLVTLSYLSEGLVHKAIAQSGSSISPWAISYDPRANAIAVAEKLGHIVSNDQQLADIFERTSIGVLVAAIKELELTDNALAFAPCIENPDLETELPLFTEPPYEIITQGRFNDIPYITGFVENEGTLRAYEALEDNWLELMDIDFANFLQPDLEFTTQDEMESVAGDIKAFYFQERSVDMTSIGDYIRYHGDTMVLVSAIRNARLRAAASQSPVYLYQFSYEGALGAPFVGPLSVEGAAHGEELAYLFDIGVTTEPGNLDGIVREILVQRWTNFAKTGIPTSDLNPTVVWSPVTESTVNYLHILNDQSEESIINLEVALVDPHPARMSFWDNIYIQHYRDITGIWDISGRNDEDEDATDEAGTVEVEVEEVGEEEIEEVDVAEEITNNSVRNSGIVLSIILSSVLAMALY